MSYHTWHYSYIQAGDTPLLRAAYSGHLPVVRELLDRGAVIDKQNKVCIISPLPNQA